MNFPIQKIRNHQEIISDTLSIKSITKYFIGCNDTINVLNRKGIIMEGLLLLFIFLLVLSFGLQFALFYTQGDSKKHLIAFVFNVFLVFGVSLLSFTSLPSNYIIERSISLIWPILSLVALGLEFKVRKSSRLPEILVAAALVGAIIQTMIF